MPRFLIPFTAFLFLIGICAPAYALPNGRVIVIDLSSQQYTAYEDGQPVRRGPVSTGRHGFRTHVGTFQILSHERRHWSHPYHVWMINSMRFDGGRFIHYGVTPGYPTSHGCVHVTKRDSSWLFRWAQNGDTVIVKH